MNERTVRTYEANAKGRFTERHRTALNAAGFKWCGYAWLCTAERPPKVWGCTVRIHKPPAPDKMTRGLIRILSGQSEFGR